MFERILGEFGSILECLRQFRRDSQSLGELGRELDNLGDFGRVKECLREFWESLGAFGSVWDSFVEFERVLGEFQGVLGSFEEFRRFFGDFRIFWRFLENAFDFWRVWRGFAEFQIGVSQCF